MSNCTPSQRLLTTHGSGQRRIHDWCELTGSPRWYPYDAGASPIQPRKQGNTALQSTSLPVRMHAGPCGRLPRDLRSALSGPTRLILDLRHRPTSWNGSSDPPVHTAKLSTAQRLLPPSPPASSRHTASGSFDCNGLWRPKARGAGREGGGRGAVGLIKVCW